MIILLLGMLLAPGRADASPGVLFDYVQKIATFFIGNDASADAINVFSSRIIFGSLFVVAFIAWTLQRKLNESKDWEEAKKYKPQKNNPAFSHLLVLFLPTK